MTREPFISVVTPCFNRARMVGEAVESVLRQDYGPCEHIVTDGGSTDGTLDVLGQYPHLRVQSEPDKSLYDALNKGIRMARGELIGHLNTDDYYPPGVFRRVAAAFAADPSVDVVYGGFEIVRDGPPGARPVAARCCSAAELNLNDMRFAAPYRHMINCRFFHRRVYDRLGLYDLRFRTGADFDFMIRAGNAALRAAFVPAVVYTYRWHAGSLTFTSNPRPDFGYEELNVIDHAMTAYPLRPVERRALSRFYADTCQSAFMAHLFRWRLRTALDVAVKGTRARSSWPLVTFCNLTTTMLRRVGL